MPAHMFAAQIAFSLINTSCDLEEIFATHADEAGTTAAAHEYMFSSGTSRGTQSKASLLATDRELHIIDCLKQMSLG